MTEVSITANDGSGSFGGYLARPESGSGPAILVAQEIFGVNAVMRQVCDEWAARGYFAFCPDLFWRQEPGIDITDQSEEEWARAFELYKGFDEDKGVEDLIAALSFLRGVEGCNGKAGVTGYCLGGKLAFLMACRSDSDATVAYYGVGIENNLAEVENVTRPLMIHIAGKDQYVPPSAQDKIKEAVSFNLNIEVKSYPEQDHAFCRTGGRHYDEKAAQEANHATRQFFEQNLK